MTPPLHTINAKHEVTSVSRRYRLNAPAGISVKKSLETNVRRSITAKINEMLDGKVGHYVHRKDIIYEQKRISYALS